MTHPTPHDSPMTRPWLLPHSGVDADLVTCAVLSEATAAGLATFCANSSANAALITQLLGDVTLMRDMLVAGGARASAAGRGQPAQAQYGPAMKLYVRRSLPTPIPIVIIIRPASHPWRMPRCCSPLPHPPARPRVHRYAAAALGTICRWWDGGMWSRSL